MVTTHLCHPVKEDTASWCGLYNNGLKRQGKSKRSTRVSPHSLFFTHSHWSLSDLIILVCVVPDPEAARRFLVVQSEQIRRGDDAYSCLFALGLREQQGVEVCISGAVQRWLSACP